MKQLHKPGDRLARGLGIARVEMGAQGKLAVDNVREVVLAELTQRLSQVVYDESVPLREVLGRQLGDLPTGHVEVKAVDQSHILHRVRQRLEQMAGLGEHINRDV